jgi:hypothetical protein
LAHGRGPGSPTLGGDPPGGEGTGSIVLVQLGTTSQWAEPGCGQ